MWLYVNGRLTCIVVSNGIHLGGDEVNWESGRKAERVEDPFPMPNGSIIQDLGLKFKIANSASDSGYQISDSRFQMPMFSLANPQNHWLTV